MKVKNRKDLYSGIMFLVFGILTVWLAQSYNLGTSARMGPGYFPAVLGGILAVIGAIVSVVALGTPTSAEDAEAPGAMGPVSVLCAMMVFSIVASQFGASPNGSLAIGTVAGCVLAYFLGLRAIGLILGAITVFGLLLKGLGLVVSTLFLVGIASLASHEIKRREAVISSIVLAAFAVGVFVYGIKLQIPIWPDPPEIQRSLGMNPDAQPAEAPAPKADDKGEKK